MSPHVAPFMTICLILPWAYKGTIACPINDNDVGSTISSNEESMSLAKIVQAASIRVLKRINTDTALQSR